MMLIKLPNNFLRLPGDETMSLDVLRGSVVVIEGPATKSLQATIPGLEIGKIVEEIGRKVIYGVKVEILEGDTRTRSVDAKKMSICAKESLIIDDLP